MKCIETLCLSASQSDLQQAAELLKTGKLVAFPTETVYGLGTLGLNPCCLQRLYEAKGRPMNNPVILHTHSVEQARKLCHFEHSIHQKRFDVLARLFWPGPLTLVCPKSLSVPPQATANAHTVAIRIPLHTTALRLLQLVKAPLAAPSANASTRISPTCAEHVLATLLGRIHAVVDSGFCRLGIESTVVNIGAPVVTLLRPGAIGQQEVSAALNEPVHLYQPEQKSQHFNSREALPSPGLLGKHYAPQISRIALASVHEIQQAWRTPATAFLLQQSTAKTLRQQLGDAAGVVKELHSQPHEYAQQLYLRLYELEQQSPSILLVEEYFFKQNQQGLAAAVADRLYRASL